MTPWIIAGGLIIWLAAGLGPAILLSRAIQLADRTTCHHPEAGE